MVDVKELDTKAGAAAVVAALKEYEKRQRRGDAA
jgi:hypothetical protein